MVCRNLVERQPPLAGLRLQPIKEVDGLVPIHFLQHGGLHDSRLYPEQRGLFPPPVNNYVPFAFYWIHGPLLEQFGGLFVLPNPVKSSIRC